MYYTNTYYGLYPTGLQCVNGVAVFNSSSTNLTTAPSQCASGFSTNNICVAPVNAAIGSKCILSYYPNCNCVSGVCTTFPTQVWAIVVLSALGAIVLVLIGVVIYLCRRKSGSERERADSLVYRE